MRWTAVVVPPWLLITAAAFFILFDNRFLIPWLPLVGGGPWVYYGVPVVMCIIELEYWYWFLGWFPRWSVNRELPREYSQVFLDRILAVWPQLRDIAVSSWRWLDGFVHRKLFTDGPRRRKLGNILLTTIRGGSKMMVYIWIFAFGVIPLGWLIAIPICRTNKVRLGFTTLLASSVISTLCVAGLGYHPLSWVWRQLGWLP